MSAFLRYTVLRLLAFFVPLFLLAMIPWFRDNPLWLLLVAATVSMLISLFFLNRPREQMSAALVERIEHRHEAKAAAHGHDAGEGAASSAGAAAAGPHAAPLRDEDVEDAEIAAAGEQYR